jgi:hypothetical protein
MISSNEYLVIFLSGLVGSSIVLLTTILGERYGSISGVITTIPTNTLVSLLGISINTNNINQLQKNIYSTLILSFTSEIYLFIWWVYFPYYIKNNKYKILITTTVSIIFYFLITYIAYLYIIKEIYDILDNKDFLCLAIIILFMCYYFISIHKFTFKIKEEKLENKKSRYKDLFSRFISTYFLISLIVFIGKIEEELGVIMSCFPLLSFINSIVLWYRTDNEILISQFNSNIMLGGISIFMYVLQFGFLLDKIELYFNVLISLLISVLFFSYPIFISLKYIELLNLKKIKNQNKKNKLLISDV